jgi:hypothetical protein
MNTIERPDWYLHDMHCASRRFGPMRGACDCGIEPTSPRLARFRARAQQNPLDHAQQSLLNAVEDINDAIQLASTKEDLERLRATLDTTIQTLTVSASVAQTLIDVFAERRKR